MDAENVENARMERRVLETIIAIDEEIKKAESLKKSNEMTTQLSNKTGQEAFDEAKSETTSIGAEPSDETVVGIKKTGFTFGFVVTTICSLLSLLLACSGEGATGVAASIFFCFVAIVFWKLLHDPRPGLRLNSKGFEFPVSYVFPGSVNKFGFIPWHDVERCVVDEVHYEDEKGRMVSRVINNNGRIEVVKEREGRDVEHLFIVLNEPDTYVGKLGFFRRQGAITVGRHVSSPIAIPSKSKLKISFSELRSLFNRYLEKYGN